MKKTISIFSVFVFLCLSFVVPAYANETKEALLSNGIKVSEIIERTEVPGMYENTTTFEVKTHPEHQELSVGAYFGEEHEVGEALVPEYKDSSAVFDFSEVELKAGDTITFFVQDGLVFSESFVRTVQAAEEGGELPDTATNAPTMLALSVFLIGVGGVLLIVRRRKPHHE